MIRKEERELAFIIYAGAHPSDYTNDMYDIGDIEKAFEAGAEWADENPDGKMLLHVLGKGVEQGKREMLDKVCEWLSYNVGYYSTHALGVEYMCECLRKAMEDKL